MNNIVSVLTKPNTSFIVYNYFIGKDGSKNVLLCKSYQADEILIAIDEDGNIKCRPLSLEDIIMNKNDNIDEEDIVMTSNFEIWLFKKALEYDYGKDAYLNCDEILDRDYEYKGEYEDFLRYVYDMTIKLPDLNIHDEIRILLQKFRNYENKDK